MFRDKLTPLCLAGLLDLCVLAPAQAEDAATRQLITQGNYWHDQGRDDLAADVWRKLLAVDPAQPDALLGLGMIDLAQGRAASARQRLQLLQARHPDSPQARRLQLAVAGGSASGNANLVAARRAASAGRYAEAVRAYETLFKGQTPTDDLALEYYQALAGTPNGWQRARAGLARLHAAYPADANIALALAQALTYRESTRREGIAQLQALARGGTIAGPARRSWRQALLWLQASTRDAALFRDFLAGSPDDAPIKARLRALQQQAASARSDPADLALGEGFKALSAGELDSAERHFLEVLKRRPHDAEALGGLGSVRLRQQRFAEAEELLRQAQAGNGKWRSAYDAARYWLQLQQARSADAAGDAARARTLVEQALPLQPREPTGYVMLAGLQAAAGDASAAEANYRKALELDGDDAGALQGLADLYSRRGRLEEAQRYFAQLPAAAQAKAGGVSRLQSNACRARARQALAEGDLTRAQSELEAAMVEQPGDPWIRLDLARLYQRSGRPDQARSVMDGLLALHGDMPEAQYANALLAQQRGDWSEVYASLERIPAAERDADMDALHDTAWVELQAAQAKALRAQGRSAEASQRLSQVEAALSSRLDRPALVAALAGAWADVGDVPHALGLAQRLATAGQNDAEARLLYASVLLRAHQDAELAAVLRQLQTQTLTPEQLTRYTRLRTDYSLRQVDALRALGNLEAAYDVLAPLLAQQPQDGEVLSALARLYAAAGDARQALALYRQVLQRSPDDLDTLVAAANAAAQSDLHAARDYLDRALALAPQSPEVLAAAGRVYRAAGKDRQAARYFRAALVAQQRQAGQLDNGLPAANGPVVAAAGRPLNPFAGMTGSVPASAAAIASVAPAALPSASGTAWTAPAPVPVTLTAATANDLPPPVSATGTQSATPMGMPPVVAPRASRSVELDGGTVPARRSAAPVAASAEESLVEELRQVQSASSSRIAAGASYRSREGEAGLGRLDDVEMPIRGEFALGEGKLDLALTPTLVDAGAVSGDYATASRFGGGPGTALADALAADTGPIDDLVGSTLYQGLLTDGGTQATRNFIYDTAVASGAFQTLYNEAEGDTAEERNEAAKQALYATNLAQYLLNNNLSVKTIGTIATEVLGNPAIRTELDAGSQATLEALAASSAANQTAAEFRDALYTMAATGNGSRRLSQDDTGVGVSLGYRNGGFAADIGSTPFGFEVSNVVGGIGYRGQAGESFSWSANAARRAVSDSVLSFAGTRDARSGRRWGGVTSNGLVLSGTLDNGLLGGYVNLAAHRLKGRNVADNDQRQADLGFYVHAVQTDDQSLTAGVNLTAMRYDKNLSGFTYGHGGYFSPQAYFDLGFPVHWSGRSAGRTVNWQVDASVGIQHFRSDATPYFPTAPDLQQAAYDAASIAALLGLTSDYVAPVYDGQNRTGVSYNLSAAAEWQVAPQLILGGRLGFNNARDYRQFSANVYVRLVLDRLGAALGRAPQVLASPYTP